MQSSVTDLVGDVADAGHAADNWGIHILIRKPYKPKEMIYEWE